jgi:hypothetical protein
MVFRIRELRLAVLALALMAATVAAKDKKRSGDSLADVTKEVKTSVSKGDLAATKAALARALQMRSRYQDKQLKSLVTAVSTGVKHKNPEIAVASIQALAALRVKGSAKSLSGVLSVPRKLEDSRVEVHLAAIRAAGELGQLESAKSLEKLIMHADSRISVAAAEAMAGFGGGLEEKATHKLLGKLAGVLDKLEAAEKKSKKEEDKLRMAKTKAALLQSVGKLAGADSIDSADALRNWLKEAKKQSKS